MTDETMVQDVQDGVSEEVSSSVDSSSSNITTSLITYRTYGAVDEKGFYVGVSEGAKKTAVKLGGNPAVLSETQTHKNWDAAEEKGATILNSNQFKFYTLSDVSAFSTLVPDAGQQLYIIQKGLDALQTAAANRIQTETQEKKTKDDPDVYMYNEEVIDLREAINKPPEKKNLTPMEKFSRAVAGIDPTELSAMIAQLTAKLQSGQ